MKLNYKRTLLVGLAFLSINAFWQMYDGIVPKILKYTFDLGESKTGVIMAMDNILALFLLPFFGTLSDRCKSRLGRRTPFIIVGTVLAVILMNFLPLLDNSYFAAPEQWKFTAFILVLFFLLIAMAIYRSPAVALMPDVTPKPLRSKGNAVINLTGAIGGISYLILTGFLYPSSKTEGLDHVNYQLLFWIVSGIMVVSVLILVLTIRERKLSREVEAYERAHPEDDLTETDASGKAVMPAPVRRSMIFLLLSVALWYFGYNGITTFFTTYAQERWGMAIGDANKCLTLAMAFAIVSYLPVGMAASKVGRKKCILFGVALLAASFFACFIHTLVTPHFTPVLYVFFALVGVAWATINVNSFPMVVEMAKGSDTGKYTGLYYTFSTAAQIVTPMAAGWLLEHVSYDSLLPYASICVALAFLTMLPVRHGDNRPNAKAGLEAFEDLDV